MSGSLVEESTEGDRLLDEMINFKSSFLRTINQLFPNGADPAVINAIFNSHSNSVDDLSGEVGFIEPYQFFAKQVVEIQSKYKSNLDFALERASKETKEALIKEYFKYAGRRDDQRAIEYCEHVDLIISECIGMYTPAGDFGQFIEKVMKAISEHPSIDGELGAALEQLDLMLSYKWASDPQWKQQDYMGIDFGLGYLIGLVTPVINGAEKWGSIEHLYPKIKEQINSAMQSKRGQRKGGHWIDGMSGWLSEKIKGVATKKTKTGLSLVPSNRAFALSIRNEAMTYRQSVYGSKWTNEQAAFEWIQKTIKKILQ